MDFNRQGVKVVDEDATNIIKEMVARYEAETGKVLQPAHAERLILNVWAYREYLLRCGINEAFRQTFPQTATGQALDMIGEMFDCARLDGEDDEEYRERVLQAPEAFTTCGTRGSYIKHVKDVSADVADVDVSTPSGGQVLITILSKHGLPASNLLAQIQDYVASEERRPLCDKVTVQAPTEVAYTIKAELDLLLAADEATVLTAARASLDRLLASKSQILGADVVPLEIMTALKVDGVYNVRLTSPALTELTRGQWANCRGVTLTASGVRKEG